MPAQTSIQPTDLNRTLMSGNNAKGSKVINPNTGRLSYGHIPQNSLGIPSGPIYLKLGNIGAGKKRTGSFGARHIWEKHKTDLRISNPEDTAQVVANILATGVNVLVDFNAKHSPSRPVVLNTAIGRVALVSYKESGGVDAYSIVSAYGNKNASGTVIGILGAPQD
ncbi:hypothetical protein I3260_18880 [Photobacterium damselae]|uniref:Uncharacterized protein n=1 Tax=Photobacterium damselae subsp. damselae TaxID=85581 RepID=A0A850R2T8_PHODD|nr:MULTISPECIES: hypothetical protein [Gammaproteobacteria]MCG3814299.1 hypothetical protein [Photobacterium damselae]MCG3861759.1 hypothetical protein [Psychrobacter sp. Ps5]MCG3866304.1 hypothetical protein [Photobacterium sp. Ph6]NVP02858.1 hypothetical protein [Photobacterium damselae subsp. damselae]